MWLRRYVRLMSGYQAKRFPGVLMFLIQRVRKIRVGITFDSLQNKSGPTLSKGWDTLDHVLQQLASSHPDEVRRYELDYHMINEKECPWHRHGTDKHKGRFGHMGECLDCLEELKKGRCTVDVTQFDYRWYWTVKRFWDQVDVRGEDECWPWLGATKKGGTESVAYCPSPVHSGATQSAMRVAFWLGEDLSVNTESIPRKVTKNSLL